HKNDIELPLMPIALKTNIKSKYIMVALIDLKGLLYDIDEYFADDFFIIDSSNTVLYSSMNDISIQKTIDYNDDGYIKSDDGYIFTHKMLDNELLYCKLLSKTKLKRQLNKTNSTFK